MCLRRSEFRTGGVARVQSIVRLRAGELRDDVKLASMPGVLGQDVETDPLQRRRIFREATPRQSAGLKGVVTKDRPRALTHCTELPGQLLGSDVVVDGPSCVRSVVGAATSPGFGNVPVTPRLGDWFAEKAPDEPSLFHVQQVAQQFDGRPVAG